MKTRLNPIGGFNGGKVDATDEMLPLLAAFERHQVEYVLIGGAALNVHGLVRATEDIDIFVRPTPENVERLRAALREVYNDSSIDEITYEDLAGEYPAIRYGPPRGSLYLDIISRLGEIVRYEDLDVEKITLEGVCIRVATPRTLLRMKRNTVRPIDRMDAQALIYAFDLDDEDPH